MKAISIKNLKHKFNEKIVLDNIDLEVDTGEIFGLLGPSGAGKTTLIYILTGQLKPTSGSSFILGTPSANITGEQYRQIGMMMDNFGLYDRMNCYDNLKFYQMIDEDKSKKKHVLQGKNRFDKSIEMVLNDVGLLDAKKTLVMNLSKGMTNRLAFARAVLRTPAVLFLDEPTSGLDPTTVKAIHQMILAEKKRGTTIFLTTHNMYEAEQLCDNIALLNNGKIVEYGTPSDICRRYNHQKRIDIHLKNGENISLQHNSACGEQIKSYFLKDEIETIHSTEPNLETVFMELTGKELEQ